MKATLEFFLDDLDDQMAHKRCVKALDMALTLWEISNLHSAFERFLETKHTEQEIYEFVTNYIREQFETNHINLEELIV